MSNDKNELPFESQTHFLSGPIDPMSVDAVAKWLMNAKFNKIEKALTLHINSVGGDLADAVGVVDIMRGVTPVRTLAYGNLMSSAFLIFASGVKGYRAIGKNTSIMIHQFNDELGGKYHDMKAYSKECDRHNDRMAQIISDCSNLTVRDVKSKLLKPTDVWLTAEDLIYYGIADIIF